MEGSLSNYSDAKHLRNSESARRCRAKKKKTNEELVQRMKTQLELNVRLQHENTMLQNLVSQLGGSTPPLAPFPDTQKKDIRPVWMENNLTSSCKSTGCVFADTLQRADEVDNTKAQDELLDVWMKVFA